MIGKPDRRTFLKRVLQSAAAAPALASLSACDWLLGSRPTAPEIIFPPNRYTRRWLGDDCTSAHGALRRLGGEPPGRVQLRGNYDVIVIGAGISGATAAYLARAHNVLLVEAAAHIGGNAQVLGWGGHVFSGGSAYLMELEPTDLRSKIYRELQLDRIWRVVRPGENIALGDDGIHATALHRRDVERVAEQTDALQAKLGDKLHGVDVPWRPSTGWSRAAFEVADRQSLHALLVDAVGELHPLLSRYIDATCMAAYAAHMTEVSGYCGAYLLADELANTYVLPGGNGVIAERMVATLRQHNRLRVEAEALAYRVEESGAGVDVWVERADGRTERYRGRTVIVAAPKVVARRIVVGLPQRQAELMATLRYRAYLVANVLLKRRPQRNFYDLFHVAGGALSNNGAIDPVTDTTNASYAQTIPGPGAVFTLYRPLARDDGARTLCGADRYSEHGGISYAAAAAQARREVEPVLFALGLGADDIYDVALSRWGHGIILSAPGQLANGTVAQAAQPFGRIFFANQDSQGVAAIENAMGAAIDAVSSAGLI